MMTRDDLLNYKPQILADEIVIGLKEEFTFLEGGSVDVRNDPRMEVGRVLEIPTRGQLAKHSTKAPGAPMASSGFGTDKITILPTTKALEVPFHIEAQGTYSGDLAEDIKTALTQSITDSVDSDVYLAFADSVTPAIGDGTKTINLDDISLALSATKVKNPSRLTLYVAFEQMHQIRTLKDADGKYLFLDTVQKELLDKGVMGTIWGIKVKVDEKVTAVAGVYTNYLVEDKAVILVWNPDGHRMESSVNWTLLVFTIHSYGVWETALNPTKAVQPIEFAEVEVVTP